MTPLFSPLTVGFDWEVWLVNRAGLPVKESRIQKLRVRINRDEPDLPTGLDLGQLELRSGVARNQAEIVERARRAFGSAQRAAGRRQLSVFALGGHPLIRNTAGGHVHVGCAFDFERAHRLKLALARYAPAFIALSASSPVTLEQCRFKSSRTALRAMGCLTPVMPQPAAVAHARWGEDVCLKLESKPTVEMRCLDTASDPNLFAELVLLVAGFSASLADELDNRSGDEPDLLASDGAAYLTSLENRYNAALFGLQAMFRWNGGLRSAGEVCLEMLDRARPALARLGTTPEALGTIRRMAELGQTQADWARATTAGTDDPFAQTIRLCEAQAGGGFDAYLANANRLAPTPHVGFGEAIEELVTERMEWGRIAAELAAPPAVVLARLRELEQAGRVRLVRSERQGLLCEPARSEERARSPSLAMSWRGIPPGLVA